MRPHPWTHVAVLLLAISVFWTCAQELWRFSIGKHSWKLLSPTGTASPGKRYLLATAVVGHTLVLYGGLSEGQGDVWGFDLLTNTWERLSEEVGLFEMYLRHGFFGMFPAGACKADHARAGSTRGLPMPPHARAGSASPCKGRIDERPPHAFPAHTRLESPFRKST
jgi:hypothetical protein